MKLGTFSLVIFLYCVFLGIPLKTTMDNSTSVQYATQLTSILNMVRSAVRDLDCQNDLTYLRIRTKKSEILLAPGMLFILWEFRDCKYGAILYLPMNKWQFPVVFCLCLNARLSPLSSSSNSDINNETIMLPLILSEFYKQDLMTILQIPCYLSC